MSLPMPSPRVVRVRSESVTHVSSKFESVDYDVWTNDLLIAEEQILGFNHIIETNIIRWFLYFLVGVFTGFAAAFIDIAGQFILDLQNTFVINYLKECEEEGTIAWYATWYLRIIIPALITVCTVVYFAPSAAGSGIPYLLAFLNGVQIPKVASLKLLIIKVFGVIVINISGLVLGKEGPFIHIGAVIGSLVIPALRHISVPMFLHRHFPLYVIQEKRDLMTAGCAAGFAAAFGSPIGATLLSLEEGTSFWSVELMWRIFFCSVVAVFTFNTSTRYIYNSFVEQQGHRGLFFFGSFSPNTFDYNYVELPIFMLTGVIGGLFGAFFIYATSKVDTIRKKYTKSEGRQIIDCLMISLVTASLGAVSIHIFNNCKKATQNESSYTLHNGCCNDTTNQMAFFWLNSPETIIRHMFHGESATFRIPTLLAYFFIYYGLFIITTGVKVPVGVFIPSLLLGATWGRLVGEIINVISPQKSVTTVAAKYAILGAAAQIGGVIRITLSLAVVMIEATGSLTFGLPIMITFFITKWVGDFFTEGIYETQVHSQGIPILPAEPPALTSDISAKDLMNKKVVAFPVLVTVGHVANVLEGVVHQGFPVVEEVINKESNFKSLKSFGELRGFILRSQLLTIMLTRSYTPVKSPEERLHMLKLFRKYESGRICIQEIKLTEEEKKITINLTPYMNPSPYSVPLVMSFPRIFRLLRSLGLRHVIVVNNKYEVLGIITRKDLAKFRLWRHAASMGLKELRIQ